MARAWGEVIFAAFLAILGIGFAIGGLRYGLLATGNGIGAGMVPFGAGALLAIFALMRLAAASRQWLEAVRIDKRSDAAEKASGEQAPLRVVLIVFALSLAAILLVPVLGFLLSFGLLMLVLTIIVERVKWWHGVLVAAIGIVVVWVVFIMLLNIPVPEGFL